MGELRIAGRRERQVAERAAAVPALVARLGGDAFRLRCRVDPVERSEPFDP
jgi:hypothetical protein